MRTITRGVSFPVKQTMKVLNTNSVLLSIILKTYLYGHKSPYEALVNFIRENSLEEILMVLLYQVLVRAAFIITINYCIPFRAAIDLRVSSYLESFNRTMQFID